MEPLGVVEALDVPTDGPLGGVAGGVGSWSTSSALRVAKKLSATALSQQSPVRLMLATIA